MNALLRRQLATAATSAAGSAVRVRYAPSPTGSLHLGGLRTALFNYLLARSTGGTFILRIEDTDKARQKPGSIDALVHALTWCGLDFDEGPVRNVPSTGDACAESADSGSGMHRCTHGVLPGAHSPPSAPPPAAGDPHLEALQFGWKGQHGPYIQSQRLPIYREHAERLLASERAYRCFCSPERLQAVRDAQMKAGTPNPVYDRTCLHLPAAEVAARVAGGVSHVVRMLVPAGQSALHDEVLGGVAFSHAGVDDQVLLKSDGYPTYHLASVVDDHLMAISHVIRGQEWLSSTPKHLLLYQAFGWRPPAFAHLPLLLNPDRSKLSKRHGDASVEDFQASGFMPEALLNFVAFLGWSPPLPGQTAGGPAAGGVAGKGGRGAAKQGAAAPAAPAPAARPSEVLSLPEMVPLFSLSRVNKANAVVDVARLQHFNGQHIRRLLLDSAAGVCPGSAAERGPSGAVVEVGAQAVDAASLAQRAKDAPLPLYIRDSPGMARIRTQVLPLLEAEVLKLQGAHAATGTGGLVAAPAVPAAAATPATGLSDRVPATRWNALLFAQQERVHMASDFVELLMPFCVQAGPGPGSLAGADASAEIASMQASDSGAVASPAAGSWAGGNASSYGAWMRRGSASRHSAVTKLLGAWAKAPAAHGSPASTASEGAAPASGGQAADDAQLAALVAGRLRPALQDLHARWGALERTAAVAPAAAATPSHAQATCFETPGAALAACKGAAASAGLPPGLFLMALRYLLTGIEVGAGLSDTLRLLGRDEARARVDWWCSLRSGSS
jgi:glutamyl/glutaminyl-tRNA synthetase